MHHLRLQLLPQTLAICRFPVESGFEEILPGGFFSYTRTANEISIICEQSNAPAAQHIEHDWRALRVKGILDFSLTGIIAALSQPLAFAGIAIFVLSTFDTDYMLIKRDHIERAIEILQNSGYSVSV